MVNKTQTQNAKKVEPAARDSSNRTRKLNKKDTKKQAKRTVANKPKLASGLMLIKGCLQFCSKNARLLVLINLVYIILHVLLVRGLSSPIDVTDLRDTIEEAADNPSKTATTLSVFSVLVSRGTSGSDVLLQLILFILISLVMIWTLRQLFGNKIVTLKQAYYNSTSQLVPFLLTAGWVFLHLIPLAIGTVLLQYATYGGSVPGLELLIIIVAFFVLAGWSLYLVSASLFALYIVTLPDMTPLAALRSAKRLVRYRRIKILLRLAVLPVFLLVVYAAVLLPSILYLPALAEPLSYVLSIASAAFTHIYIYHLYRELLK